ncbi:MAG TPA: glycosyltransferase family 9 protein [bacterium]|nr:glycosyltransferase family 9 protein [bacterium]
MSRFHFDCRFFRNDRPCLPHKATGVRCENCVSYSPVAERILIVKLAARGDVLRTTSILEPLKRRYPKGEITWLVDSVSSPLLENIPEIDRIWIKDIESLAKLQVEQFDLVCNLDLSPDSCALASIPKTLERRGYILNSHGRVAPVDPVAERLMALSLRDDLKRANTDTYQKMILELLNLPDPPGKIIVNLTDRERDFARQFADRIGLLADRKPVFGINVGAGGRWQNKTWKREHLLRFIQALHQRYQAPILLLGGSEEAQQISWLREHARVPLFSSGTDNTLRQFMAIMSLCDAVVTGDTMALHIALGLGCKAVAFFGPTSSAEIEMYEQGLKLSVPMDCLCCYQERCSKQPDCMDLLTPEEVLSAVGRLLGVQERERRDQ